MTFETAGATYPPAIIPRVLFDVPLRLDLATVKSPKSAAFPVDAIVTKPIIFVAAGPGAVPPANTPRVVFDPALIPDFPTVKSPNFIAVPPVENKTKSIN